MEGTDAENVRIEYNPNRPDFSSQYGIVRALKGLLEIEVGIPSFRMSEDNKYAIRVDGGTKQLRPYIGALVAHRIENLTNEDIRELIVVQEDLHNGVGRHRKRASIGIHNLGNIQFPIRYTTAKNDFSFAPLDMQHQYTIEQILNDLDWGKEFGSIFDPRNEIYPIIIDSNDKVISFPPIVNSERTRLKEGINNILVEVTAVNKKTAEDILAIFAINLYDAGFNIHSVLIENVETGKMESTPCMEPKTIHVNVPYINRVLGLSLPLQEISSCLNRCRIGTGFEQGRKLKLTCTVPKYRTDIFHQIDIVEEVAIGYGIFNLKPSIPWSKSSGGKSNTTRLLDRIRETLVGLGMIETLSFSLVSRKVQYILTGAKNSNHSKAIGIGGTRNTEHEILRDSLIPSLLQTLSHNVHEVYPQKVFEIGKIFQVSENLTEHWAVGILIAHNSANYSEAKSIMQELAKGCLGPSCASVISTPASYNDMFMEGRCAGIVFDKRNVGIIGEIKPEAIVNFKLRTPVAAFELDISSLIEM